MYYVKGFRHENGHFELKKTPEELIKISQNEPIYVVVTDLLVSTSFEIIEAIRKGEKWQITKVDGSKICLEEEPENVRRIMNGKLITNIMKYNGYLIGYDQVPPSEDLDLSNWEYALYGRCKGKKILTSPVIQLTRANNS